MRNPIRRLVGLSVIGQNILSEAMASLRSRRLQAALSSFGIATGIAAVVLLVSIVSGMHRFMIEQIGAVGGNTIRVTPSPQRSTRDPRGFPVSLRVDDLHAVLQHVSHYDLGMAQNSAFGVVRTARRSSREASVTGITERGFELLALTPEHGRVFLDTEYATGTRVAVLGANVAADLFPGESAVGQTFVVADWPFQIVVVLDWVGDPVSGATAPTDRAIFVPFKACAAAFRANQNANILHL